MTRAHGHKNNLNGLASKNGAVFLDPVEKPLLVLCAFRRNQDASFGKLGKQGFGNFLRCRCQHNAIERSFGCPAVCSITVTQRDILNI